MNRALRQMHQLQHSTIPLPGDPRLYAFVEGANASYLSKDDHATNLEEWRSWNAAKEKGDALRQRIASLKRQMPHRTGDLCQPWGDAVARMMAKYRALERAKQTKLPLSLYAFERQTGCRGKLTASDYKTILLGVDPIRALSEACHLPRETVEAAATRNEFTEVTFMHRVWRHYGTEDGIRNTIVTLDLLTKFVTLTHGTWSKTEVSQDAISSSAFVQRNYNPLEKFVDVVDFYSQHRSHNQQAVVKRVLDGIECSWEFSVPDHIDQYLNVRYSTLGECFSEALPPQL